MDIYEIRRRNLLALIERKYENNRSLFARSVDKNVNTINLYLTLNEALRRNIGERNARELEKMASLPVGWLDNESNGVEGLALVTNVARISGSTRDNPDPAGEALVMGTKYLQMYFPDLDESALGFVTIVDDEMQPTLKRGELVLIDNKDKDIYRSGLFLVLIGSSLKVRRLSQKMSGGIEVSRDSTHYADEVIPTEELDRLKVVGRCIGSWAHRKL